MNNKKLKIIIIDCDFYIKNQNNINNNIIR